MAAPSACLPRTRTTTRRSSGSRNTLINLLRATKAPGLIAPTVAAGPEGGSRFQFTIDVDDGDATAADLVARGVELLNRPTDRPWGIRTAAFRDPANDICEIAH